MISKNALALLLATALLTPTAWVHAGDVDASMNRMFSTMTSKSSPAVIMNSRRGVLTGGSFSVRSQIMRPNLVSIDPPSLDGAGCAGFDMNAGSLSFISKEQFTQLGKNIMSNAGSYAFGLALGALCQDCRAQMQELQKTVDSMNKQVKNSCELAQRTVEESGLGNGMRSLGKSVGEAVRLRDGSATDGYDASVTSSGSSVAAEAAKSSPQEVAKNMPGNIVWQALKKADAKTWWPDGSEAFNEAIMSLTGTVIGCVQASDSSCAAGAGTGGGVQTYTKVPILTLQDLIDGSSTGVLKIYSCDKDACLNPNSKDTEFPGMRAVVHKVLFGEDGKSGLVPQMVMEVDGKATADADNLLAAMGGDGRMLRQLANSSGESAVAYAMDIEDVVTLEMAYRLANDMLKTASLSVSNLQSPGVKDAQDMLMKRKQELQEQYSEMSKAAEKSYAMYTKAMILANMERNPLLGPVQRGGAGSSN